MDREAGSYAGAGPGLAFPYRANKRLASFWPCFIANGRPNASEVKASNTMIVPAEMGDLSRFLATAMAVADKKGGTGRITWTTRASGSCRTCC